MTFFDSTPHTFKTKLCYNLPFLTLHVLTLHCENILNFFSATIFPSVLGSCRVFTQLQMKFSLLFEGPKILWVSYKSLKIFLVRNYSDGILFQLSFSVVICCENTVCYKRSKLYPFQILHDLINQFLVTGTIALKHR